MLLSVSISIERRINLNIDPYNCVYWRLLFQKAIFYIHIYCWDLPAGWGVGLPVNTRHDHASSTFVACCCNWYIYALVQPGVPPTVLSCIKYLSLLLKPQLKSLSCQFDSLGKHQNISRNVQANCPVLLPHTCDQGKYFDGENNRPRNSDVH